MTELQRWEKRIREASGGKLEVNRHQLMQAFPLSESEAIRLTMNIPYRRKEGKGKTRWYPTDLVARAFYENTEVLR